jgi:hypothetical protein
LIDWARETFRKGEREACRGGRHSGNRQSEKNIKYRQRGVGMRKKSCQTLDNGQVAPVGSRIETALKCCACYIVLHSVL